MQLNELPDLISMGTSHKDGRDEYYHRLKFHSLILVDGFCLFESEEFSHPLRPGDILIVPAEKSRNYLTPRSLRTRHAHFHLNPHLNSVLHVAAGDSFRDLCRQYDEISFILNRSPGRAAARFWELLYQIEDLTSSEEKRTLSSVIHPSLSRAVNYIEFNFHRKIDLDDLSRKSEISHNQLIRLFQKEFGCTITSYIRQKRMNYAKELLSQTTLPIKEISFKCGYHDRQHFNKAVRGAFGFSPQTIRQMGHSSRDQPLHQGNGL